MDKYIENLFRKEELSSNKNEVNISNNAIKNFTKIYKIILEQADKTKKFNEKYKKELNKVIDKLNKSAEKRKGTFISTNDLKNLNEQNGGGDIPNNSYCHNYPSQCSDSFTSCGQYGGFNQSNQNMEVSGNIIPNHVFKKLAQNTSKYTIPKNILPQIQHIVNDKVAEQLKK